MSFLKEIKEKLIGKDISDPDYYMKKHLLRFLTLDELMEIAKIYISKNPKFYYIDPRTNLEKSRDPTRLELENEICLRVPLEIVINKYPHLKDKMEND